MNILLISHTLGWGGVERQVLMLARELSRMGHSVTVAAPQHSWLVERCREFDIADFPVSLRGLWDIKSYAQLVNAVKNLDIDMVHGHARRSALYGAVVGRICRKPSICTVHSLNTWKQFGLNGHVIAVSVAVRDFLVSRGIASRNVTVVYNGVPEVDFDVAETRCDKREQFGIDSDVQLIGMSGRPVDYKGHDILLDAFSLLAKRLPMAQLCFIGSDDSVWYQSLEKRVAERGLGEKVHFLGYQADVQRVLTMLDAFVLPSRQEALSLSLLEAFSVGLASVASRVGGIPEVIREGETGFLFTSGDAESLSNYLSLLLTNASLRKTFEVAVRQSFRMHFMADKMAQETLDVYRHALLAYPCKMENRAAITGC